MKKNLLAFVALPLMAFSINVTAQMPIADSDMVLVAERLFDAKTGSMIANPVVHIKNDRIVSVSSGGA